jgi:hypothetical protein
MTFQSKLLLLLLLLTGCAGGPHTIRIEGNDIVSTSAGVTYHVEGYNRGKAITFVHEGAIVYAGEQSQIIAYGGITYASRGTDVHGFDQALIYYHEGAYVEVHGNARAFLCKQSFGPGFDPSQCLPMK